MAKLTKSNAMAHSYRHCVAFFVCDTQGFESLPLLEEEDFDALLSSCSDVVSDGSAWCPSVSVRACWLCQTILC